MKLKFDPYLLIFGKKRLKITNNYCVKKVVSHGEPGLNMMNIKKSKTQNFIKKTIARDIFHQAFKDLF